MNTLEQAAKAIENLPGGDLAHDAAFGACRVLLGHWKDAVRDWSERGPTQAEVVKMISGDLADTIAALESLAAALAGHAPIFIDPCDGGESAAVIDAWNAATVATIRPADGTTLAEFHDAMRRLCPTYDESDCGHG